MRKKVEINKTVVLYDLLEKFNDKTIFKKLTKTILKNFNNSQNPIFFYYLNGGK